MGCIVIPNSNIFNTINYYIHIFEQHMTDKKEQEMKEEINNFMRRKDFY